MAEHGTCGIWLQVLIVRNELDHPIPDLCTNVISSSRDELQDRVDIPLVLPISRSLT